MHCSTRKRAASSKAGPPQLPAELLALWDPLLEHLDDTFDAFASTLLWHALDVLASASAASSAGAPAWSAGPSNVANVEDKSYLATLAAWVVHLAQKEESEVQEDILRFCLVHGVGGSSGSGAGSGSAG